jgi:sulfur-carrier protein adenylyltransferase/sulfurtransferase
LDFHPMTAVTLFRLRWQLGGPQQFDPSHRRLLEALWPHYERLFQVVHDPEAHIMLFRIGRGRPVGCRTLRKPLEAFKTTKDLPLHPNPYIAEPASAQSFSA